jgi:hypothetical protein
MDVNAAAVNVSKLDLRRSSTSKNSNKFNLQSGAVMMAAANKEALSMHAAIQIIFEGVVRSDAIEGCIRQEWEGLSDIGAPVTSSRVVVSQPRAKHFSGDPCRLRVHLTVEGSPDININHDPGAGRRSDAMRLAVCDAFRIVRRRLEDSVRRSRSCGKDEGVTMKRVL